jgi:hypothetical protein
MLDIDAAPDAAGPARAKADGVTVFVDTPADTVDPAETERLINRLGPGNASLAGALLVVTDQQLIICSVMLRQPLAKPGRRIKELGLHVATMFLTI